MLEHARKKKNLQYLEKMKKVNSSSNLDANIGEVLMKKERHIVSWSQEEDDILREQIRLHGSENWAIIASKFKDKTTRQCRRRWFTYLNSDFKKGGWSPEEDMLLCEAQRIYGNRWTEIAKVVSGRTDNAVKNRFTTLCKKRAKLKEKSSTYYVNLNNKRVISRNGINSDEGSDSALKKIRTYISTITESCNQGGASDHVLAHPFAAAGRSIQSCDRIKEERADKSMENKFPRTFLEKDDPKVLALMQQEELLSSLAIKVNTEKTDQSLESAWMVLQDFLKQKKESEMLEITNGDTGFEREKFKEPEEEEEEEDVRSCGEGSRSSWREHDVYESSPTSSEYSTGSTLVPNVPRDKKEECGEEIAALHQETGDVMQTEKLDQRCLPEENAMDEVKNLSTYKGVECDYANAEFSSPTVVTPLFRALAATIPSPKFSESEKHFLMKTLGLESSSPTPITNPSQPPPCKRSLLHCL